jgi:hypothetical protein
MRACATAPSQRSVPTVSMPIWPDTMLTMCRIDQRLQHAHRAVVEEVGIVVVRRAAEEFDIVGAVAEALFSPSTSEGLLHANLEVVEGGVVVDIAAVADQRS